MKRLEAALKLFGPGFHIYQICSRPIGHRFHLPNTMTQLCRPARTGGASSFKEKRTGSSRSKSITAF